MDNIKNYISNLKCVCRLCGVEKDFISLTNILEDPILLRKIETLYPIKVVEGDSWPKNICESCYEKTEESFSMYASVCATDRKLRLMLIVDFDSNLPEFAGAKRDLPSNFLDESSLMNINKSLMCPHCSKTFETNNHLRTHVKLEHSNEISSRKYNCRVCCKTFLSASSRDSHQVVHSNETPFLCDHCGKSFKQSSNFRIHLSTHSTTRKKYTCDKCGKSFLTRIFLKEHQNKHLGITPYKCQKCGKAFHGKIHLRQHMWTHAGRAFHCAFCNKAFNRKGNMSAHIKEFHLKNKEKSAAIQLMASKIDDERLPSTTCDDGLLNDLANPNKFGCKRCKNCFPTKLQLKDHARTHVKSIQCKLCGKTFQHHGSLTYHRRVAHTGERPYKCGECDASFHLQSLLTVHERRVHTGLRPFQCSICERSFFTYSILRTHQVSHSEKQPFTCEVCGKGFRRKGSLSVHLKGHYRNLQHVCTICSKTFVQKSTLLKHKAQHHPDRLPFFCKFCGGSFAKRSDSIKHSDCKARAIESVKPASPTQLYDTTLSTADQLKVMMTDDSK